MEGSYPVCWQDQRLIFGPLNSVYQDLRRYETVVQVWDDIPKEEDVVWSGQPGYSALIFQAATTEPYGETCYQVNVERDISGYPKIITLGMK